MFSRSYELYSALVSIFISNFLGQCFDGVCRSLLSFCAAVWTVCFSFPYWLIAPLSLDCFIHSAFALYGVSVVVRHSSFPQRKVPSMSLCAQSCNISYFFSARVGTLRVEVSHISPWFLLLSGSVFNPLTCLGSLHLHVPVSHLERYRSRNFCASSWFLWVPADVFIWTLIFRLLPFSFRDTSPS